MLRSIIAALMLGFTAAHAADTPASEESIREMLRVTDARKLVDGIYPQLDAMMRSSMQQAMKGRPMSPEAQKATDKMSQKMTAMFKETMSWEALEPLYIKIYQKSFTQEELDGIIAFYKTPAGTAMIKKLPLVMQESMTAMQGLMGPMMQKVRKAVQETVEEVQAEKAEKN